MRKALPLLLAAMLLVVTSTQAAFTPYVSTAPTFKSELYVNHAIATQFASNLEGFMKLTPSEYHKLTGKKLTLKETLKLKAAQKLLKKQMNKGGDGLPKGVYILLAIFGLAWIAMGVKDDWNGNNWWVNLILTLLCWIPGFIHALVKMKEYY